MSDVARFNWRKASRKWGREWRDVMTDLIHYTTIVNTSRNAKELKDAADRTKELDDQRVALLAQVLEHVPSSWLADGAPSELDWGKVESFDWLMDNRMVNLIHMVQTWRTSPGESPRPMLQTPDHPE